MYMFKYIMTRIFFMLLALVIIFTATFFLIKQLEPIPDVTGALEQFIKDKYIAMGYGKPLTEQFAIYVKNILLDGDWGISFTVAYGKDIATIIGERLPPTLVVNLLSFIVSVPLGILFGIIAAKIKNSFGDAFISTAVMVVVSVPSYIYGLLLQYYLGFKLGLPPLVDPIADHGSWFAPGMIYSMIIPVIALSLGTIAGLTRFTRAELSEVMTNDYMLLARTKGLTKQQALTRHALRNAMVPIFPSIIAGFIGLLSGSLVIEGIFGIPGIGNLYLSSMRQYDYNVFIAISMFYTIVGLIGTLVVDLSYGIIDPRIRMGAR